jgi:hypothetical protein
MQIKLKIQKEMETNKSYFFMIYDLMDKSYHHILYERQYILTTMSTSLPHMHCIYKNQSQLTQRLVIDQ